MEVDKEKSSPDSGTKLQVVTELLDRLLNSKENKVSLGALLRQTRRISRDKTILDK